MDREKVISRVELDYGLDDLAATVRRNRSYRRFDEGDPIGWDLMVCLVDLARQTASAANLQPLRYRVVADATVRDEVFGCLGWAGYLADWDGPEVGERPTGYIVVCCAGKVAPLTWVDAGIAAQTVLLGAVEAGFGGCIVRNFSDRLPEVLGVDPAVDEPLLVIALGAPRETCVIEPLGEAPDGIRYWRDADGVHHVPKRPLEDVLI